MENPSNRIVEKGALAPSINMFVIEAPRIARKARPGQFVMVRVDEKGERVPMTIADSDVERGTITLTVQEVGKTTIRMGTLQEGDCLLDLIGPLGRPSEIERFGTVVLIGGGIGTAPVYPITKAMKEADNSIIAILGARSKELVFWEQRFREICDDVIVTTDDGSYGRKGLVTDALADLMRRGTTIDRVIVIGPVPMMKAVVEATRPANIKTIVSLNPIMVDATGMCGGCRVTVGGKTRFACVDGPEFDGHLVDFNELRARQRVYEAEEKACMESCRLGHPAT